MSEKTKTFLQNVKRYSKRKHLLHQQQDNFATRFEEPKASENRVRNDSAYNVEIGGSNLPGPIL